MTPNARFTAVILALLLASPAGAQDSSGDAAPDAGASALPSWVRADPFASSDDDDPLSVDRADRLETVSPTRVDEEAQESIPVHRGDVLAAIAGVRETSHRVEARFEHGLAIVDVTLRFTSSARHPAELRYRLAVPEGASLARLEVCNEHGCRSGAVDEASGSLGAYDDAVRARGPGAGVPVAHAAPIRDARGDALWLRAAPVMPLPRQGEVARDHDGALELRLRYVASAPLRGGRARLALPERGHDVRIAPAQIRVRSDELSHGAVDGADAVEEAVEHAAWEPAELSARLDRGPRTSTEAWLSPCGAGRCARVRAVAAPMPLRARDVVLLLDASPSTADSARGRIGPAVAALLSAMPGRSRLRIGAFAARAEPIVSEWTAATDVSIVAIARALEQPLGSATRFEAAWAMAQPWLRDANDPLLIVVGDGGLTTGEASRRSLRAAHASGAELAFLDVADRPSTDALRAALASTDASILDVGVEADRATRGHGMDPLVERISALLSPVVEPRVRVRVGARTVELGALHAGEERVWEGPIDRGTVSLVAPGRARATPVPEELAIAIRDRLERASGQRTRGIRLAAAGSAAGSSAGSTPASEAVACTIHGPFRSPSPAIPTGRRLVLVETRRCDRPSVPEAGAPTATEAVAADASARLATLRRHGGPAQLPARSLLAMLRQRIVPVARSCFRDDRRGRGSYQSRAVFTFTLADREVVDAEVDGRLAPPLRECLERAIDGLEIPRFDGVVRARYPIYTAPTLPPPTLSLDAEVADAVDAVADDAVTDPTGADDEPSAPADGSAPHPDH